MMTFFSIFKFFQLNFFFLLGTNLVFGWLDSPLPKDYDPKVSRRGSIGGIPIQTELTDFWMVPLKQDPVTKYPTSPYFVSRGIPSAAWYPSECGNGKTLNNSPFAILGYHLQGQTWQCDVLKDPSNVALTGSKELSDKYLARLKKYNITVTELNDSTKWSCGLTPTCLADKTCCPFLKIWLSANLYNAIMGWDARYINDGINAHEQATFDYKLTRFQTVDLKSADGPLGPGTAMTNYFDPFAGWNGQSAFDQDSLPYVNLGPGFDFRLGPGQACVWTNTCKNLTLPATLGTLLFGAPILDMNFDFKRGGDMPASPHSNVGVELRPTDYLPLIPEVYFKYNRCLDPTYYKRLSRSYSTSIGIWPNRTEPGPDHPSCTDGFNYRGRDLRTELEWTKGNNTGNIYDKEELFVLGITFIQMYHLSQNLHHLELALQIVNDPNQNAFPNLKNFFIGMVLGEDAGMGEGVAAQAMSNSVRRLPSGTFAFTGLMDDRQCAPAVPIAQEANLAAFVGGCKGDNFRDKNHYPFLLSLWPQTTGIAKGFHAILKKLGWFKIHMIVDSLKDEYANSVYRNMKNLVTADIAADTHPWEIGTDYSYLPNDYSAGATIDGAFEILDAAHDRVINDLKEKDGRIILPILSAPLAFICRMIKQGFVGRQYVLGYGTIDIATVTITNYGRLSSQMACTKGEFDYWLPKTYLNVRAHERPYHTEYFFGPKSKDPSAYPNQPGHAFNNPSQNPSTVGYLGTLREISEAIEISFDFNGNYVDYITTELCGGTLGAPQDIISGYGFDAVMLMLKALDTVVGKYNYTSASDFANDPDTGVLLDKNIPYRLREAAVDASLGDWLGITGKVRMDPVTGGRNLGVGVYQLTETPADETFMTLNPPLSLIMTGDVRSNLRADLELSNDAALLPSFTSIVNNSVLQFADPSFYFDISNPDGHATNWHMGGASVGQGNSTVPRDRTPICAVGRTNVQVPFSHLESCDECADGSGPHPRDLLPTEKGVCYPCAEGYFSSKNTTMRTVAELGSLATVDAHICEKCPVGTYTNETGQTECIPTPVGTFASERGSVNFFPCPEGTYTSLMGEGQCIPCAKGTYQPNKQSTSCLSCPSGLTTPMVGAADAKECQCPENTFAKCLDGDGVLPTTQAELVQKCGIENGNMILNGTNMNLVCETCPVGMDCRGYSIAVGGNNGDVEGISNNNKQCGQVNSGKDFDGNNLLSGELCIHSPPLPKLGYWAAKDAIYMNYDCYYKPRCPGNGYEQCAENWNGFVCADCDVGFRIKSNEDGSPKSVCETCEGYWIGSVITPFVILVGGSGMYVVYYLSAKSRQVLGRIAITATAGLMLQTLQFLSLFDRFSLAWKPPLSHMFESLDFLSFDLQALGSSCVLGNDPVASAFIRLILPFYLVIMLYVTAKLGMYVPIPKYRVQFSLDAFLNGLGVIWLVFFVSMLLILTSLTQCYEHPAGGSSLVRFPEIRCGESNHLPFTIFFILGLIAYVVVPLFVISTTVYRIQADPIKELNPIRHFFLIARYGVENMHFTILTVLRNTALGLVPVVLPNNGALHIVFFSLIAIAAAVIVLVRQPWKAWGLNLLDGGVLTVLALVSAWGFALLPAEDSSDPEQVSATAGITLIILTFCFLFFTWFSFFCGEFLDKRSETLIKWGYQAPKPKEDDIYIEKRRQSRLLTTEAHGIRSMETHEMARKEEVMAILLKEEKTELKTLQKKESRVKEREEQFEMIQRESATASQQASLSGERIGPGENYESKVGVNESNTNEP